MIAGQGLSQAIRKRPLQGAPANMVDYERARATRRLRALQKRWIPQHEAALAQLVVRLWREPVAAPSR